MRKTASQGARTGADGTILDAIVSASARGRLPPIGAARPHVHRRRSATGTWAAPVRAPSYAAAHGGTAVR